MLTTTECLFCAERLQSTRPSPAARTQSPVFIQPSWWPKLCVLLQRAQQPDQYIRGLGSSRTVVNLCIRGSDIALACHLDCLLANQTLLFSILQAMSSSPPAYRESQPTVNSTPITMPDHIKMQYEDIC